MFRKVVAGLLLAAYSGTAVAADTVKGPNGETYHTGLLKKFSEAGDQPGVLYWSPVVRDDLPAALDHRVKGEVAPVRNQGSCGSCWAFSITKTLESARLRNGLPALDLAEQQMVSCDKNAYGCGGGMMDDMDYVVKHGLPLEADYAYTASDSRCKSPEPAVAAKGVRWGYCGQPGKEPTTAEIKQCLYDYGVLSVVVAAGGTDWSQGGRMTRCGTRGQNHMVNLIGYEADGTLIGRNSWGTSWGDKGDFYARQGCDELASGPESVSFVVVEGAPGPVVPHITLPATVSVHPGTEIALGRRTAEPGVSYEWYAGKDKLPDTTPMVFVTPTKFTVYRVRATTKDGTAESSVKVKVLESLDD